MLSRSDTERSPDTARTHCCPKVRLLNQPSHRYTSMQFNQRVPTCVAVLSHSTAASGCAPRDQRALLDVDMNALIDPSSCLVDVLASLLVPVQSAPSTSSAASGRCSRISPSRGLVKALCSQGARSESLSVVGVLAAASLLTTRCVPAAAHQVVISCDMSSLSQRCGSDVILASSSCLAVYVGGVLV